MMQTVFGAFDDPASARHAVERLVKAGFAREDLHVQHGEPAEAAKPPPPSNWEGQEREVAVDIRAFSRLFDVLFGAGRSSHAQTYSEAVRRGSSVVVVDAHDDDAAEQAAGLLHELGAIDVHERARQWEAEGWVADGQSQAAPADRSSLDCGGVRVIRRESEQPVREIVQLWQEETVIVQPPPGGRGASPEDMAAFRDSEAGATDRALERERAVAADRSADVPLAQRDPDAGGTARNRDDIGKDKPPR